MSILDPARVRRRSTLILRVFGASLVLVALVAVALVQVVSSHLTSTAIDVSVSADRSLVRGFTAEILQPADLAAPASAARIGAVNGAIDALVDRTGNGILHVKVFAPDGTILFSNRPELVGTNLGIDDDLRDALTTRSPVASIVAADDGEASTVTLPPGAQVLEEYVPIEAGASTPAVFEIYRNAAPILAHVDAATRDVVAIIAIATALLALGLYLVFRATQRRLDRQTTELVEATRRDALSGMLNHGAIVGSLTETLATARETGGSVGIALLDLDNFRLLNDTHGHHAGDQALVEVSRLLRLELSQASELGRFGPDEFLVVAPPACVHDLEPAIGRLRERLVDLSLQFGGSERLPVTISAGISYTPAHGESTTELLSTAGAALSEAKASGGNGIRIAERSPDDLRSAERSSFDILTGLVVAVDTKDRYTKRHSEDVARYALFTADRLGIGEEQRRAIEIAGLLHDVGKIGIPDVILRKPGALTADEFAIVKQHVALGDAIVRDLPDIEAIRSGVRHHHERWDGTGYLDGLAGEDIPLIARVLAVADAFSAMTTSRPYRKALSVSEALRRLEDAAGSQLDERIVVAFVSGIETVPEAPLPGQGLVAARGFRVRTSAA